MYAFLFSVFAVVFGWIFYQILQRRWKKYPPGPIGLPIIGNLHQMAMAKEPSDAFKKWNEVYGGIVGFHLGQYRVVMLNGYETIKEAYNMAEFSGRQLVKPFHEIAGGEKRGLLLSEGVPWTEQRRFALRNLRDFGFGKKSMESIILEDIEELIENFKETDGKDFVPHRKFSTAVVKSLWNIVAGERFTYGDPKFQSVLDSLHSIISSTSVTGPVFFMPWVATLLPGITGWNAFKTAIRKAKTLIQGYIEDHKNTFQDDNIRDFIDVYLKEINETKDPNSSFYKMTGEKHLLVGTLNLFVAGSETTSNTLVWALLFLIKYPQVQKRLYEEIVSIISKSRMPSLQDRNSCPYAVAVMEEVFRLSSLLPFGVLHNTMTDIMFKGYFIPKDTLIMANIYGVHNDKKTWGDPHVFRPERFLTSEGKLKRDIGPVIPFSIGKRACLGETLARNNFFLYLTSLVQKFEFSMSDKQANMDVGATIGFFRTPTDFSIVIKEREY